MTRFYVSLVKRSTRCPFCHSSPSPRTVMGRSGKGWTQYRMRCARNCPTHLYGAAVTAGAPFSPGDHLNDRRAS